MSRRQERTMSSSPYGERDSPRLARDMANEMISPARHIWRAGWSVSSSPYDERDGPRLARHMASGTIQFEPLRQPASFLRVSIELSLVSS
ncbi:hypothetical protein F2Q69_00063965 [Brassica cretica]|uniref:Uncharacterized protein n=1 Tax=Brassica cretica TaxID=69181 RepID=A0A8S9QVA4_BRACR|nr:hypothetical protein F2Q69_00063965 [Brassica cretica]